MSLEDFAEDPAMTILEALAAARGLRLVPVEAEHKRDLMADYEAECRELPTDQLVKRLEDLKDEEGLAIAEIGEWRKEYDRLRTAVGVIDLPWKENANPPSDLTAWQRTIGKQRQVIVRILTERITFQAYETVDARFNPPVEGEKPPNAA